MEECLVNLHLLGPSGCFDDDVFLTLSCGSSSSSSSSSSEEEEEPAAGKPPAQAPPPPRVPRLHYHRQRRGQKHASSCFDWRTCGREFPTFQALGGHPNSHLRRPAMIKKQPKVHACAMCGLGFSTGQALGGHIRRHRAGLTTTTANEVGCGGPDDVCAVDLARAVVLHGRPRLTASLQLLDLFV